MWFCSTHFASDNYWEHPPLFTLPKGNATNLDLELDLFYYVHETALFPILVRD